MCKNSSSCLRSHYFRVFNVLQGDWWQLLNGCSNSHRSQVRSPTFSRFRPLSSQLWTQEPARRMLFKTWLCLDKRGLALVVLPLRRGGGQAALSSAGFQVQRALTCQHSGLNQLPTWQTYKSESTSNLKKCSRHHTEMRSVTPADNKPLEPVNIYNQLYIELFINTFESRQIITLRQTLNTSSGKLQIAAWGSCIFAHKVWKKINRL